MWLTMGTRTVEAEVLGSTPWHEPSQSPPLAPPKSWVGSSVGSPQAKQPSADKLIKVLLSSAHQGSTQFYPPPVPPIRKLAQTS